MRKYTGKFECAGFASQKGLVYPFWASIEYFWKKASKVFVFIEVLRKTVTNRWWTDRTEITGSFGKVRGHKVDTSYKDSTSGKHLQDMDISEGN